MLSLQMKSGDYVTIGENVVVQVFRDSGPQFRISIKAPKEIPIMRGAVLERAGQERPVRKKALRNRSGLPVSWKNWQNARKPGKKKRKPVPGLWQKWIVY